MRLPFLRTRGKLDSINPSFINPFLAEEFAKKKEEFGGNLAKRITGQAQMHQLQAIRRTSEAALALEQERGDYAGVSREVDRQVEAGIMLPKEAQRIKLEFANKAIREQARARRSVSVDGQEYMGQSALLAVARSRREGGATPAATGGRSDGSGGSSGDFSLEEGGRHEAGSASGLFPDDEVAAGATGDGTDDGLVPPEESGSSVPPVVVDEVKAWENGNSGWAIRAMSPQDAAGVAGDLDDSHVVSRVELPNGRPGFTVSTAASPVLRVATSQATAAGGFTATGAQEVVAHVTLDALALNPQASEADILKNFEDSGVYEALGDGNPNVGKQVAAGIVAQYRERGLMATGLLTTPHIRQMVKAHVVNMPVSDTSEAGRMPGLKPTLNKEKLYKKPNAKDDPNGRQKWNDLYAIYQAHRTEYAPGWTPVGENEDIHEEFEKHAMTFWDWYMKRSGNVQRAEAAQQLAESWYLAQIGMELARNAEKVTADGVAFGNGYANSVAIVNDVLARPLPDDLGADAFAEIERQRVEAADKLGKMFREDAKKHRASLNQGYNQNAPDAAMARGKEEQQRRAEALGTRRLATWRWDGLNTDVVQGMVPSCTIPKSYMEALCGQMGYDGRSNLYISVGGTKILITGTNDEGIFMLNSPAVFAIQPKPKKGQLPKDAGAMQYIFTE